MKQKPDESDEKVLLDTIQVIQTVADTALQVDLLSVMTILASEKFSKELVQKFIRREQLMESVLFREWISDFVDEAEEVGEQRGKKEKAIEVAKKLLAMGMSTEQTMQATDLSYNIIQGLKEQILK